MNYVAKLKYNKLKFHKILPFMDLLFKISSKTLCTLEFTIPNFSIDYIKYTVLKEITFSIVVKN